MGQAAPNIPQNDTASVNANNLVAAEPSQCQEHQGGLPQNDDVTGGPGVLPNVAPGPVPAFPAPIEIVNPSFEQMQAYYDGLDPFWQQKAQYATDEELTRRVEVDNRVRAAQR